MQRRKFIYWAVKFVAVITAVQVLLCLYACAACMMPRIFRRLRLVVESEKREYLPRFIVTEAKIVCRSTGVDYTIPIPPLGATVEVLHCNRRHGDSFNGSLLMSWNSEDAWISKYKEKFLNDYHFELRHDEPHTLYILSLPYKNMGIEVRENNATSLVVNVSYWYDDE